MRANGEASGDGDWGKTPHPSWEGKAPPSYGCP